VFILCEIKNKTKNFIPFPKSTYNYTKFLDDIYTKKLTGLLVVKNLQISKQSQNPIFGFINIILQASPQRFAFFKIQFDALQSGPTDQEIPLLHYQFNKKLAS